MTSKLTREQLHERARENVKALKMASRQHAFESARDEILADLQLAELALAAMDSDPVAWLAIYHGEVYDEAIGITRSVVEAEVDRFGWEYGLTEIIPLYRHAQPALTKPVGFINGSREPVLYGEHIGIAIGAHLYADPQPAPERDQVRREHAAWSQATFGNVGPVGPLKHLSKEALEAAAEPGDLSEWADIQFLLWDAQRRAGITDEQITNAMIEKLAVNKQREWPEPKDGEPRLHIKEQPAAVVPEEMTADGIIDMHECGYVEGWNACRAAMLNGGKS